MNAHNFIKIAIVLQNISSYMFLTPLAHHQGAHSCIKNKIVCSVRNIQELVFCNIIVIIVISITFVHSLL
jgi:hypothetical protein